MFLFADTSVHFQICSATMQIAFVKLLQTKDLYGKYHKSCNSILHIISQFEGFSYNTCSAMPKLYCNCYLHNVVFLQNEHTPSY